jgi:two-component system CheB/CheR fusion protein
MSEDAQQVLRTLAKVEKQVALPDGDWFMIRILPYRTLENRIDGVVVTFTDITASKKLESNETLPKE